MFSRETTKEHNTKAINENKYNTAKKIVKAPQ